MSSRDWFWFLAGVLVAAAIMATLRPWMRKHAARPDIPELAVPLAAALGLIGVALGVYFLLGSPGSKASAHGSTVTAASMMSTGHAAASPQMGQASANAGALDEVTQKLANRLALKGGSESEWQLLAQSYDYMGRAADAKAARAHKTIAAASNTDPSGAGGGVETNAASGRDARAGAQFDGQTMAAVADALDNSSAGDAASASAAASAR